MTKNPHYSAASGATPDGGGAIKPGANSGQPGKPSTGKASNAGSGNVPDPPRNRKNLGWWIALGLIIVAGAAVATYFVLNPIQREVPDGVTGRNVSVTDVQNGQCMRNFKSVNDKVDIVDCSNPHNAQLIGSETSPQSEPFPGSGVLQQRSQRLCKNAPLDPVVVQAHPDLKQTQGLPTKESWDAGDRRIDCIAFTEKADALKESVLLGPDASAPPSPGDPGDVVAPTPSTTPTETPSQTPSESGTATPSESPTP